MSSRFDLAHHRLLKALELLNSPAAADDKETLAVRVRVLLTLSTVEAEIGSDPTGMRRLLEAAEAAERLADPGTSFAVDGQFALRQLRNGDPVQALRHFARAETNVSSAAVADACIMYLDRGNLHLQRLELNLARRDLNRCIGLASAAESGPDDGRLRNLAYMARHNLGYLEFLAGNLPKALQLMDEAAALSAGVSLAVSALDKARVLIEAGLSDAADRSLVGAEAEFRRGRLHIELAETQLARAECAMLAGNLKAARALAASARSQFKRAGNDLLRRVAELTLVSADLLDGRPATRLVGPATRLAAEFRAEGLVLQAKTAALLGCSALLSSGRLDEARERFAELPPISHTDPIGVRLQQRVVAAGVAKAAGLISQARSEVRTGLVELSRHQAQFGSIDLQTASAVHGRQLVRLDFEMALKYHRPGGVFNAIERGRAVSRRLTAVTPPTGESADLLAELRQLTETVKMIGDDPAAKEHVNALRRRGVALYSELSAISWRAVGVGSVIHPATMSQVADAATEHGRVLVSYCQFDGRWSAVVLGNSRARFVPLPGDDNTLELVRRSQADLNVLAFPSLPNEMRRAATASVSRALSQLDELLVAPLKLGDQPLAVVPTGSIVTLPWNCLPSLRGRSVEVSPTATSWLWGTLAADLQGDRSVAAFAGPGLALASGEADKVANLWGGAAVTNAFTGREATRAQLSQALASATVVHVAAHGAHMSQNPMFSSLELFDGPLYAYEIADHEVAPHVVLSACELGQATMRPGDEALGLTRVLLQLGAQCVVAGVAQVADDQAGVVMADYHRRLAAGDDSASALAAATASEPYVPFVCFGSTWRAREEPAGTPRSRAASAENVSHP